MTRLVWLRRDLRLQDNPALAAACQKAEEPVIALFAITPDFWQQHHEASIKLAFTLKQLQVLQQDLAQLNIPLLILETTQANFILRFSQLLERHTVKTIYYNDLLEPDEKQRDAQVQQLAQSMAVKINHYQQSCLLSPGMVLKSDDTPYKVFTSFKNRWLKVLEDMTLSCLAAPSRQQKTTIKSDDLKPYLRVYNQAHDETLWPVGEQAAQSRLENFCRKKLKDYAKQRDIPSIEGTSLLSPYLSVGVLSVKQCWLQAKQQPANQGRDIWLSELIWRDFYQHILCFFPRVGKNKAFKLETERVQWHNNDAHFIAWCQGKTGVPIVDAAMRQLNQLGWMHNRLRMISAMFLSKNLFLNWRLGEQYFMNQLIDGDLAANNGGWQWSASTGTDAVPYFRVFNPYKQSERFDPSGDFIRQYCPELAHLNEKQIHQPPITKGYPSAIVDAKTTRAYAIEMFKKLLNPKSFDNAS